MKKKLLAFSILAVIASSANAIEINNVICKTSTGYFEFDIKASPWDEITNDYLLVDVRSGNGNWDEMDFPIESTYGYPQHTRHIRMRAYSLPGVENIDAYQIAIDDSPIIQVGSCN